MAALSRRLDEANKARHRHGAEVDAYEAWMRSERGLSEETIRDYRAAADQFLEWLAATDIPLAWVRIVDIDDAINDKKARGTCGRRGMHDYAQRLRAFFRFAEARGWCTRDMANGIMPPRFMRDEAVPKGLKREDVLRLLATTEGDRLVDKRDRAILMLFIAYGLRASEVGGLRLDDLCPGAHSALEPRDPLQRVNMANAAAEDGLLSDHQLGFGGKG